MQWRTISDTCPVHWITISSDNVQCNDFPVLTMFSAMMCQFWHMSSAVTYHQFWHMSSALTSSDNVQCNGMPVLTHVQHSDVPVLTHAQCNDLPVLTHVQCSDMPVLTHAQCSDLTVLTHVQCSDMPVLTHTQRNDLPVQSQESLSPIPADQHQWQNHDCGCDPQSSAAVALHLSPPLLHTCPCVTCTNTSLTLYQQLKATKKQSHTKSFSHQNYYWSLLYNTILWSRADSMRFTCF